MRARGRLCVTKIFEPTNDPQSSIPESGKGRGESDGEKSRTNSHCILFP